MVEWKICYTKQGITDFFGIMKNDYIARNYCVQKIKIILKTIDNKKQICYYLNCTCDINKKESR